jgi:hypothetical protein
MLRFSNMPASSADDDDEDLSSPDDEDLSSPDDGLLLPWSAWSFISQRRDIAPLVDGLARCTVITVVGTEDEIVVVGGRCRDSRHLP